MPEAAIRAQKVLGFALQRRRHSDGEVIWMPGWIDGDKPSASYFRPGNDRTLRRLYFSGQ